jgi:hypothetical protein
MAPHKQHDRVEAKLADTRISRDKPTVADLKFTLTNREVLVVEVPRHALERLLVRAKRAIEAAPLLAGAVKRPFGPFPEQIAGGSDDTKESLLFGTAHWPICERVKRERSARVCYCRQSPAGTKNGAIS